MRAPKQILRQATDLFRACQVNGALDEARVRQTVQQIGQAKPRGYLAILSAFRRLVQIECERHTALVESAQPLPVDQHDAMVKTLSGRYGAGLSISFAVNPALVGGVRIQVGSDVYDGSVRGRLAALERTF